TLALRILDVSIANVPFPGHGPIEHLSVGRNVVNLDRDVVPNNTQGLPNPVARDAAANRKQLGDEPIHFMPDIVHICHWCEQLAVSWATLSAHRLQLTF